MKRCVNRTLQRQPEVKTEVSERQLKTFADGEQQYSTSIPNSIKTPNAAGFVTNFLTFVPDTQSRAQHVGPIGGEDVGRTKPRPRTDMEPTNHLDDQKGAGTQLRSFESRPRARAKRTHGSAGNRSGDSGEQLLGLVRPPLGGI